MDSFSKYFTWIVGIITIVGVIIPTYFCFYKETLKLEVQTINERLLTAPTDVEDLNVNYRFKDTIEVHNLWQVQYVIRNIGDATLIGEGSGNMIIGNGLPYNFSKDGQILSSIITLNNIDAVLKDNKIKFKQWRKNEFIELTALIESSECPKLTISDRDIKDSEIIYSTYSPNKTGENNKLIRCIPEDLRNIFKWYFFLNISALNIIVFFELRKIFKEKIIFEKILNYTILVIYMITLYIPLLWMF